jgi:hypothetical protein
MSSSTTEAVSSTEVKSSSVKDLERVLHMRRFLVPAGFVRVFYTPVGQCLDLPEVKSIVAQVYDKYVERKSVFVVLGPGDYTLDSRIWRTMAHKTLGTTGKVFKTEAKQEPNHGAQNAIEFSRAMSLSSMLAAQAQLTIQQVCGCCLCVFVKCYIFTGHCGRRLWLWLWLGQGQFSRTGKAADRAANASDRQGVQRIQGAFAVGAS